MAIKESVLKDNIIHFILNVGLFITCMKPDIHLDMQLYICTLSKTVPHLILKQLPQSSWKYALSHLLFWGTFWWHVTLDLPEISYSHTKKRKEKVEILKTNNKYKKIFIWLSFTLSVTNHSSFQNYPHPDDHTIRTTDTPGFKPFTMQLCNLLLRTIFKKSNWKPCNWLLKLKKNDLFYNYMPFY